MEKDFAAARGRDTDGISSWEWSRSSLLWSSSGLCYLSSHSVSAVLSERSSQSTDIPIPKVYDYDLDDQNTVGCPFSLMEYVHGNTAEEVAQSFPGDHEGIPEEFEEKFWRQVGRIMVQLASIRMPNIGSIYRDESDPSKFVVGPLVKTGSGPYESSANFYTDYPVALGKTLSARGDTAAGQDELLEAFRSIAASFSPTGAEAGERLSKGFGLANYDLNPNNILVDREFNILAVIDWDSVISVPDAALYRMPFLMGIACPVPGSVDDRPPVVKRWILARRFAAVVEEVAREKCMGTGSPGFLFTQAGFFSKDAVAFRSLVDVQMKQDWVNAAWLEGLKWLQEQSDAKVTNFYFQD